MNEDDFISIKEKTPLSGEYCTIKVVSYFKAKYLPSCKGWPWLMDENVPPTSHVTAWKREKKGEFL